MEKCLTDISQTFTHSCSRVESRTERIPSNHCPKHSRPLTQIQLNLLNQNSELPELIQASVTTTPTTANNNVTRPGDATTFENESRSPNSSLTNTSNSAICENCVEHFKIHILDLCKKGLHKIPIVNWPKN